MGAREIQKPPCCTRHQGEQRGALGFKCSARRGVGGEADMPRQLNRRVSFAVADALQGIRIVQDGFKSRAEAEKFIEDYYLARGIIAPPAPKKH